MLNSAFSQSLLFAIIAAAFGGIIAKKLRIQPIIGYIFSGIILGAFLPSTTDISQLAELGIVFLLFSLGLEFPVKKISKMLKPVLLGVFLQTVLISFFSYFFFLKLGFDRVPSLIFAFGIASSSTAIIVKILSDKGETDTLYGVSMTGWLLIQDLMVIPAVVLISSQSLVGSLIKATYVILTTIVFGRLIIPYLIHKVASLNSRELLLLSSLGLAIGIAYLTYLLGISPSLGAFLAGLVLAEAAENRAVFAEVRPFRDIFVAIFFVTLGFMVKPSTVFTNFFLIVGIAVYIVLVKSIIDFAAAVIAEYKGKTAIAIGLGMSQAGEFSFVVFSLAASVKLLESSQTSVVIASALITLLATPFLFRSIIPVWKKLKDITQKFPKIHKYFIGSEGYVSERIEFSNHIIICGYGRVGAWVGRALEELGTPFVIVDYNRDVVSELKKKGLPVIFGDPAEIEVLEAAGIGNAKAVVLAIPDRISQEILIGHVQTLTPKVMIISRVHLDSDLERLRALKIDKIVQPEFEAAMAITKTILVSMGKSREEIDERIKKLRISHGKKI